MNRLDLMFLSLGVLLRVTQDGNKQTGQTPLHSICTPTA